MLLWATPHLSPRGLEMPTAWLGSRPPPVTPFSQGHPYEMLISSEPTTPNSPRLVISSRRVLKTPGPPPRPAAGPQGSAAPLRLPPSLGPWSLPRGPRVPSSNHGHFLAQDWSPPSRSFSGLLPGFLQLHVQEAPSQRGPPGRPWPRRTPLSSSPTPLLLMRISS